ncbi:MAG: NAD(P)-binding domain-containing protein [bacterium]
MKETDINVLYEYFRKVEILEDKVNLAQERGSLQAVLSTIEENIEEVDTYKANDIAIIGAGDFGVAIAESFKTSTNIIFYDFEPIRNIFSRVSRISTNRSYPAQFGENIDFTANLQKALDARFIILCVPANALPIVIDKIKEALPVSYKEKQYVLVSKGFVGKGYIPHRWLEKSGIPFEQIIWASGGNVAKTVVQKKSFKISVVSINKNKKARREFANFFNRDFLVPLEYSGSALLACELGGILKNYYAGLGRYILLKYGEKEFYKYKMIARQEFRRAVRSVSGSPMVSIRGWVIRKASHGPAFWEDLDVTIREGRNGFFGEKVFNGVKVKKTLDELGLVESFKTVFSTLSLFNRLSRLVLKRLPILRSILEVYEDLHIEYLDSGDAHISEESKEIIWKIEKRVLKYNRYWFF